MAGVLTKLGNNTGHQFIAAVGLSCLISLALLAGRISSSDSLRYIFLVWNLVLAVIPLLLAWWLYERLQSESWLAWPQVALSALYLGFLPNTFYLITDFVHLRPTDDVGLYFDVVMLAGFMANGIIFGFASVYLLHRRLMQRIKPRSALYVVAVIFLLASFATYLGRFTRFNTWDILLRPAGLLFDVSDRLVNPTQHSDTYLATLTLFAVLFSGYLVIYTGLRHFKTLKA